MHDIVASTRRVNTTTHRRRILRVESLESRQLLAWLSAGPAPTEDAQVDVPPNNEVSGAIQAIAAHPSDPDVLYIGAVNGGIWKTTDATAASPSWTVLTDALPSQSIGALKFDPTDGTYQTLLAGTGRFSNFGSVGDDEVGLYYTVDGGANWTHFNNSNLQGQRFTNVVARGSTMFAASNVSGLFRTTNGGTTWTNISGANGLGTGPVLDLVEDPGNSDRLYAAVDGGSGGIFRTDNATAATPTWTDVTTGVTAFGGSTSNMRMAIHDSGAGNAVYLAVVNSGVLAGVYRSINQGSTWTAMDTPVVHNGGQGTKNTSIAADPNDVNLVYIAGDRIASSPFTALIVRGDASLALGSQFTTIVDGNAGGTTPHADTRAMVFDANDTLLESDDGGIYRRSSPTSSAGTWSSVNGNLQVSEIHDIAYDPISDILMSGTQDNGTQIQQTSGNLLWTRIFGGDGGDVAVDGVTLAGSSRSYRYRSSQNLGHGSGPNGNFTRLEYDASNTVVGIQFIDTVAITDAQFVTPVEINTVDPSRMLFGGSSDLYESLNITSGSPTITNIGGPGANGSTSGNAMVYGGSLAGSPNPDLIYIGTSSILYKRTVSGGAITPTSSLPAGAGTIRDVAVDPDDWMTVFAVDTNQVFMSTDAGTSWSDITGNLTSISSTDFRTIEWVPGAFGAIVVGTRSGAFASTGLSFSTWSEVAGGLPDVLVYDLEYDATDDVLVAGTFGRGAWLLEDASTQFGVPSTVTARHLFYNQSAFDGSNASINVSDDGAIATDKTAYLPGDGLADFDNVSSYSRGINGIMIDLLGSGDHSSISLSTVANDFVFKVGNNNTPSSWAAAPTPSAVSVRTNFDGSGTDRVVITWANGAIDNQWLEVQVLPTSRTGLTATDVFFWGNKIGDIGSPTASTFTTTAAGDANPIIAGGLGPAGGITNVRDIDRSNTITAAGDRSAALVNIGALARINIGTGGPFAPQGDSADGNNAIASAVAAPPASSAPTRALPVNVAERLASPATTSTRVAAYLEQWVASDTDDGVSIDDDSLEALLDALAGR